jgi:iron complex outermembrane receptor protein
MLNISSRLHFDVIGRYLDYLPKTIATELVPAYYTADARLAFNVKGAELSVVGKDLFSKRHREFQTLEIPRSIYAKLTFTL